ncbi:MAG TPA: hypothetical protein VGF23_22950 [Gaiellaceae bacterium]|jgi:hypothetical protein
MGRSLAVLLAALVASLAAVGDASASQLIDRDAKDAHLAVNSRGEAMLTYRKGGKLVHVLAWGAVDARQPGSSLPQVKFQKDYAGGWGKYRRLYWREFGNTCRPYDGPKLAWFVAGCKAGDGSYWALQSWQTPLPDLGFTPWTPRLAARELHLSHWTGPTAQLEVWTNWVYSGRFQGLFGRVTYDGQPVYGLGTTNLGAPTDGYGRLLYLDTHDSVYGEGWRRENSFVPHNPTGVFCYGFYPFDPTKGGYQHPAGQTAVRGPGTGDEYRITINGPGVTPDVMWQGAGLHAFDQSSPADVAYEQQQNAVLDSVVGVDKLCRRH